MRPPGTHCIATQTHTRCTLNSIASEPYVFFVVAVFWWNGKTIDFNKKKSKKQTNTKYFIPKLPISGWVKYDVLVFNSKVVRTARKYCATFRHSYTTGNERNTWKYPYLTLCIHPSVEMQKVINLNSKRIDHVNRIDFMHLGHTLTAPQKLGFISYGAAIDVHMQFRRCSSALEFCVPEVISVRFIMIPPAWKHNRLAQPTTIFRSV